MKKTSEKPSTDTRVDTHLGKAQSEADAPQVGAHPPHRVFGIPVNVCDSFAPAAALLVIDSQVHAKVINISIEGAE